MGDVLRGLAARTRSGVPEGPPFAAYNSWAVEGASCGAQPGRSWCLASSQLLAQLQPEPHRCAQEAAKPQLSAEEKRRAVEEAAQKAKLRREKDERELAKQQELERIRSGKEMAEVRRVEESQQVRRWDQPGCVAIVLPSAGPHQECAAGPGLVSSCHKMQKGCSQVPVQASRQS